MVIFFFCSVLAGCLAGMYVCDYYCYFFLNLGYRSSSMYNRHTTGYGCCCCCCCCWWLLFPSICSLFFHIFLCISNRIDERKFTFGRFTNDLMEFSHYKHVFPFYDHVLSRPVWLSHLDFVMSNDDDWDFGEMDQSQQGHHNLESLNAHSHSHVYLITQQSQANFVLFHFFSAEKANQSVNQSINWVSMNTFSITHYYLFVFDFFSVRVLLSSSLVCPFDKNSKPFFSSINKKR